MHVLSTTTTCIFSLSKIHLQTCYALVGESSGVNAKQSIFSIPPKNSTAFPQSAAAMSRLIASKEMNLVDVAHSFFTSRDETAVDKRVREEIGETRLPRPGDEAVAASESGLGRSLGELNLNYVLCSFYSMTEYSTNLILLLNEYNISLLLRCCGCSWGTEERGCRCGKRGEVLRELHKDGTSLGHRYSQWYVGVDGLFISFCCMTTYLTIIMR